MAYLGNTPTQQGFIPAIDFFSGNGATVAFTLSRPVASVAQVQATIENVPQNPGTAFTVSGNTITFDGAPPSGTNNIYVYYTSPITQVIQPGQGTVFPSSLSVPNALFWNTSSNVGVGTTSPTARLHTQVSSGNTIARFVNTSSTVGELGELILAAPNRPAVRTNYQTSVDSNGFFNYDSGSFIWFNNSGGSATERMRINSSGQVTIPSQPAFSASLSTNQSITAATNTKLNYNSVEFNTGGHFNTANNRFTAPLTGRYLITITNNYTSSGQVHSNIFVNGGNVNDGWSDSGTGTANSQTRIFSLNANDYVEGYAYVNTNNTLASNRCKLAGYLIG
jgi:hypothetical protein